MINDYVSFTFSSYFLFKVVLSLFITNYFHIAIFTLQYGTSLVKLLCACQYKHYNLVNCSDLNIFPTFTCY